MRHLLLVFALLCGFSSHAAEPPASGSSSDMYDFRFMPVGLIIGAVSTELDIKIADDWTLGPQLSYWHHNFSADSGFTSSFDVTAWGAGVRANWFKNGAFNSGLYVGPSLGYANIKVTTSDSGGSRSAELSTAVAEAIVGYAWFWNSFNILLGGGVTTTLGSNDITVTKSDGSTYKVNTRIAGPALEFSLGWTF
jgi:hypothetical protein